MACGLSTSMTSRTELNQRVQLPGLTNAWVWPIKTRIDMLATGIKTPVGIKVAGPDLRVIQQIGKDIEACSERSSRHRIGFLGTGRRRALCHGGYSARPGLPLRAEYRRRPGYCPHRHRWHERHGDG